MRTEIYINAKGQIVEERQALSKHPDGNAQQRKKAIRSGWQPSWRTTEKRIVDVGCMNPPTTEEGVEIYNENQRFSDMHRDAAEILVQSIDEHNAQFAITESKRVFCVLCGSSVMPEERFTELYVVTETNQDSIGE